MKVLLVIDMVKGFVEPETNKGKCNLYMPEAKSVIPNINREIANLKQEDALYFVCDSHKESDKEFEMFPPHCIGGTEECKLADGFKSTKLVQAFPKSRFSALYKTPLEYLLSEYDNVEEVIVTGVATGVCILFTVADLRMRDYNVRIPKDCVCGVTKRGHDWALMYMKEILGVNIIKDGVD